MAGEAVCLSCMVESAPSPTVDSMAVGTIAWVMVRGRVLGVAGVAR